MNNKHMHSSFFCFLAFFSLAQEARTRQKKERVKGLFRVHFSFEKCNMSIYGAIVAFPLFGPVDSLVLTTSYQLTGSRRVWEWEQESKEVKKKRQRRTMIYLWPQIALGVLCCDWSFNELSFSLFSPKSDSFVRGVLCLLSFPSSVLSVLSVLTHGPFKPTLNTNNKQDGNTLCLGHSHVFSVFFVLFSVSSLSLPPPAQTLTKRKSIGSFTSFSTGLCLALASPTHSLTLWSQIQTYFSLLQYSQT